MMLLGTRILCSILVFDLLAIEIKIDDYAEDGCEELLPR